MATHNRVLTRTKKWQGGAAILIRAETSPEDVSGMHAAEGILTQRGGMTSHAAVVARGWGKTCVSGCQELIVNDKAKTFELGGEMACKTTGNFSLIFSFSAF